MAGIDTGKERSIFEYRGRVDRPIPPPGDPLDALLGDLTGGAATLRVRETDPAGLDATLNERGRILQEVAETDRLIDDVSALLNDQMAGLTLPVTAETDPSLLRAIQQLGGTDTITFDLYQKAQTILRNAQLASLCVDPVHLVFAPQGARGPRIPRVPTLIVTCEEASNPNLFAPPSTTNGTVDLASAMDVQKQMSLYRVLLLTWWGLMSFMLTSILRMVERLIRGLRKTIVLRPLARLLKPIAQWLRGLICWSERKIYGRPLSAFCKQGKPDRDLGFENDKYATIPDGRKLCQTLDAEGNPTPDTPTPADCLDEASGDTAPDGAGCPVVIPPECTEAAQTIVQAAQNWALHAPDSHGPVNPAAFLVYPIVQHVIDLQETGKFMLVSQDQSELTEVLSATTQTRPSAVNRWGHPFVTAFRQGVPAEPVVYTTPTPDGDPVTAPLAREECD